MVTLPQALRDWSTGAFEQSLKNELLQLDPDLLPLQQGVARGGYADPGRLAITLLEKSATATHLVARVGLFYHEIIAGCSCGDDPVVEHAYSEMRIRIERQSAVVDFELL